MATRTRFDFYKNNLPDDFPSNQGHFKFLGLLTVRKSDLLKLRGKPLSLKSCSKGTIDVICRNAREFEEYLSKGSFQRHHIASIMTQLFDPLFCLNAIFFNIAKFLNREITSSYLGTMPWLHKIDPKYNRKLVKIVRLYFRVQYLNIPRYILCKDLPLNKMNNMILAFSDGSLQLSTSTVYLVSFNPNGHEYAVTLISTLSRLGQVSAKQEEEKENVLVFTS